MMDSVRLKFLRLRKAFVFALGSVIALTFAVAVTQGADETTTKTPASVTAATAPAATTEPAPAGDDITRYDLLMMGLGKIGLGDALEKGHIKVSGYIEQSFTANFDSPTDPRLNDFRLFDDRANDYWMNQLNLRIQRDVVPYKAGDENGDMGFMVDLLYGSDTRFIHQRGLMDRESDHNYQFDPTQFYGTIRLPVGNGILLKGGKFVTTIGAETVDPRNNALFSHSYLFYFSEPVTHTGGYVEYPIVPDAFTVYYAPVLGWDVWSDNNDAISHMFGSYGTVKDFTYALNLMLGPEERDDESHNRFLLDLILTYQWTPRFSTTVNFDYGYEGKVSALVPGQPARWYGAAGYATYQFCSQLKATVRGEYFRDGQGFRTGRGVGADLYEVTVGVDIIPVRGFGNLRLRPELRWDHSSSDALFKDNTKHNQYTFGIDAIVSF